MEGGEGSFVSGPLTFDPDRYKTTFKEVWVQKTLPPTP